LASDTKYRVPGLCILLNVQLQIHRSTLKQVFRSFQYPGNSEDSDGGIDNDGGGDEELDENIITNNLSPLSTAVLLTIAKESVID